MTYPHRKPERALKTPFVLKQKIFAHFDVHSDANPYSKIQTEFQSAPCICVMADLLKLLQTMTRLIKKPAENTDFTISLGYAY